MQSFFLRIDAVVGPATVGNILFRNAETQPPKFQKFKIYLFLLLMKKIISNFESFINKMVVQSKFSPTVQYIITIIWHCFFARIRPQSRV